MVCTQLHGNVNAFYRSQTFLKDTDCFVNHRDQQTVYNEARSFNYFYRNLVDIGCNVLDTLYHFIGGGHARDNLNQLHDSCRVKEMHADNRTGQLAADFRDGQGRCIGSDQSIRTADVFNLLQQLHLCLQVLNRRLNNQVCITAAINICDGNLAVDFFKTFLGNSALRHHTLQRLLEQGTLLLKALAGNHTEADVITLCLCECLCDAQAHNARSNYCYFHTITSFHYMHPNGMIHCFVQRYPIQLVYLYVIFLTITMRL